MSKMANEKRLIDATGWDSFYADMGDSRNTMDSYDRGFNDALDRADDWMDAQTTVDAVEVVHGRWRMMKCVECPDYISCHRANDLRRKRHNCSKAKGTKVLTNGDWLRSLDDEALARLLDDVANGEWIYNNVCEDGRRTAQCKNGCEECLAEWLKQPHESEG